MVYYYHRAREFFDNLSSMHTAEEMHELLVVGVDFLDLGMVTVEAEHLVPGLDNLLTRLEERARAIGTFPPPLRAVYKGDRGSRLYTGHFGGSIHGSESGTASQTTTPSIRESAGPEIEPILAHNNRRCRERTPLTRARGFIFPP